MYLSLLVIAVAMLHSTFGSGCTCPDRNNLTALCYQGPPISTTRQIRVCRIKGYTTNKGVHRPRRWKGKVCPREPAYHSCPTDWNNSSLIQEPNSRVGGKLWKRKLQYTDSNKLVRLNFMSWDSPITRQCRRNQVNLVTRKVTTHQLGADVMIESLRCHCSDPDMPLYLNYRANDSTGITESFICQSSMPLCTTTDQSQRCGTRYVTETGYAEQFHCRCKNRRKRCRFWRAGSQYGECVPQHYVRGFICMGPVCPP